MCSSDLLLSLKKLFYIKKEREVLFLFLNRIEIATRKWLIITDLILVVVRLLERDISNLVVEAREALELVKL